MKSLKKNGMMIVTLLITLSCMATVNLFEMTEHQSVEKPQNDSVKIISPHSDLKMKFLRCVALKDTVLMEFEAVKHGKDTKINFGSVANVAIDNAGKQYKPAYSVGGGKWRLGYTSLASMVTADVPISVRYRIINVPESVKAIKQLNLRLYSPQVKMSSELVKIMNIPITREKQMMQATDSSKTVDEDFYTFEKRFVADSLFQMSRIIFSDLGYKGDDDPEAPAVKLSPENWSLFKKTFSDVCKMGQYKTDMKLTSDKCEQTIWIENSSFMLMYTYTKICGKWYLTKSFERY
ncbi:MAG: DUF4348 domain-containing protein [Bacteroidaceae bacterium]|nr:DUF4348 domain-containing protein [Bacteroidaceae bacterium]